jgi:hypothetical protein
MMLMQMWLDCWLAWLEWLETANRRSSELGPRATIVLPSDQARLADTEPIDPRPSATITDLAQWRIDHPERAA